MITILLVDDIPNTRENLKQLLSFEEDLVVIGNAGNGEQAIQKARELKPNIILMDVNMPVMDGISATEIISRELPQCSVIIISIQGEADYLRRAMQAGAHEYLIKPFTGDELVNSIRRVDALMNKKSHSVDSLEPETMSGTQAQIAVVVSGKGGSGKTFIAINLATVLRMTTSKRVCLLDLDLQFGDVVSMLDISHAQNITDLAKAEGDITWNLIAETLTDGPLGMYVLPALFSPETGDIIQAKHVRQILQSLRQQFDYIVIDTGGQLSEPTLEALDAANKVLVIGNMNLAALKDTRLMLRMLELLQVNKDNIAVIINGIDAQAVYDNSSIEQNLRFPITHRLPSDARLVNKSLYRGTPVVISDFDSEISQSLNQMTRTLFPPVVDAPAEPKSNAKNSRLFGLLR